jgi:hypothetical protein
VKFVRDETNKGILVGYEGDTLCRILKPDGRICRAATLQTVERILWQQFDLEDVGDVDPDTDHFTDLYPVPVYLSLVLRTQLVRQ